MKTTGTYESEQSARDGLATGQFGGKSPDAKAIIKSANARAQKRHEMKNEQFADEKTLPASKGGEALDVAGVQNSGYLTKKGLVYGADAFYNSLPPGTDIDDQENIDSRAMPMRVFEGGTSYPTDGGFGMRDSGIE